MSSLKRYLFIIIALTGLHARSNEVAGGKGDLYSAPPPQPVIEKETAKKQPITANFTQLKKASNTPAAKDKLKSKNNAPESQTVQASPQETAAPAENSTAKITTQSTTQPPDTTITTTTPEVAAPASPYQPSTDSTIETPAAPKQISAFTLKSGDFIKTTTTALQFYKLNKKGEPTKIRTLPKGTGFKVIKPNKRDTRVEFTSGPLKGQQAFIKKTTVEEIIKNKTESQNNDTPQINQPPTVTPTAENPPTNDTVKTEIEGDESGLEGTVPDESAEAIAHIIRNNCTDCTERDIRKGNSPKTLLEFVKKVVDEPKYIKPISGVRISSEYGMRRHPLLGYKKLHTGVDFAAPSGTPIKAARGGKIIHAGRKGGYGITVMIQHADGIVTLYAHMSKLAAGIKKDAIVEQGHIIGKVGSTGRSTGPHLHLEFRKNGKPQPTKKYIGV